MIEVEIPVPRGVGFDGLGRLVASVVQHRRVRSLKLVKGSLRVEMDLKEGESPLPPEYPEKAAPSDLARGCPSIVQMGYEGSLNDAVMALLRQVAVEGLLPIGWAYNLLPDGALVARNPHPVLEEDSWFAGLPGYRDDQLSEDSLLLFSGMESDGLRSATKVFRLFKEGL